jgi:hypothetical protein
MSVCAVPYDTSRNSFPEWLVQGDANDSWFAANDLQKSMIAELIQDVKNAYNNWEVHFQKEDDFHNHMYYGPSKIERIFTVTKNTPMGPSTLEYNVFAAGQNQTPMVFGFASFKNKKTGKTRALVHADEVMGWARH